ncbi:MAG: hypothetical protein JO222_02645 [Frankiales bacterium]|nr:hypothetical protein [Frankiales bacterium]
MLARRPLTAGLAAALVTGSVTIALPVLAHPAAKHPTRALFSRPLILAGGGAEPSIRVPADGRSAAYVSAPTGLGSNFWRITSVRRHRHVTFKQSPVQQPDLGTGGGDSDISVGDQTQNTPTHKCLPIAYSGLHNVDLLDNFTVATSNNCGKSFALANPFGTENTLTDRQWQVFDGAHTNFLIYHLVSTGQIVVSVSPDSGQHYVSLGASNPNGVIDPALLAGSGTNQQIGNIIVNHAEAIQGATNPVSGEPVHAMYAIFGIADDAGVALESQAPGSEYNGLDAIYVGRSIDGGVTWTDHRVFNVNPKSKRELNMLFPVISADSAGNLYAVWSDTFKIQYAVSTDHGIHWSKPYQVNRDNRRSGKNGKDLPDAGKADVFPWIAGGSAGMLDVVWYHGQGGAAKSNRSYRDPGDAKTAWTLAFVQLRHANRKVKGRAAPTVLDYSQAVTPTIHYGDVCQNGTFCSLVPVGGAPYSTGDRSLLDFFEVAIDKEGRANIAIADNAAAPGQSITAFTQQLTGYSLTTGRKLVPLTLRQPKLNCDITGVFTDPSGDANAYAINTPGPSQPGLDIRRGWVTWNAKSKAATFHLQATDLKTQPQGATGQLFRFYFGWGGKGYAAVGQRPDAGAATFSLESHSSGGDSTIVTGLKGRFDDKRSEVRIILPSNVFARSTDPAYKAKAFRTGSSVTGLAAESRRDYPAVLAPVADSAAGVCPAKLGSVRRGASRSTAVSGLLPAATDGGSSAPSQLPLAVALTVLVGLAAAAVVRRRSPGLAAA